MIKRLALFAFGLFAYVMSLGTLAYAAAFVGGFGPTSLDRVPSTPLLPALLIDAGLLALFAVQHSVMARPWFKDRWTQVVPWAIERSTYVLAASLALLLLFWQWRSIGGVVWQVQNTPLQALLWVSSAAGWALALIATVAINHFELFGLRQVWLPLIGRPYSTIPFSTPGLYRVVRHPLYLGFMLAFWMTPTMTVAHLLFAVTTTAYILIAIQFEEHDLTAEYGDTYREYRGRVRMILPLGPPAHDLTANTGAPPRRVGIHD